MKVVKTEAAPAAIGPYNQAVICDGFVFTSGQIPIDPATGAFVPGGIREQTHQVFRNLQAVLAAADTDLSKAVKVTVFLQDMGDFAVVNEIYGQYFPNGQYPARSAVQVACLPKNALVEIEAVAAL